MPKKQTRKSSSKTKTPPLPAYELVQTYRGKWAAYSNTGRLIIVCSHRRIAELYASNTLSSGSKAARRPTRQSEDG